MEKSRRRFYHHMTFTPLRQLYRRFITFLHFFFPFLATRISNFLFCTSYGFPNLADSEQMTKMAEFVGIAIDEVFITHKISFPSYVLCFSLSTI